MPDTRSQGTPLQPLIPEIDKHYHQLRRENLSTIRMDNAAENQQRNNGNEEASKQRDLVHEITYGAYMQPGEIKAGGSAIVLSVAARNMEIKSHHFHDMPKYYGMDNEDVIRFLKEFVLVFLRENHLKG